MKIQYIIIIITTTVSLYLSAPQLKEFFGLVKHLWASLLILSVSALHGIEMYLILVHFLQIVLPIPLHEYKDQTLVEVKYRYMIFLPVEFSKIPGPF